MTRNCLALSLCVLLACPPVLAGQTPIHDTAERLSRGVLAQQTTAPKPARRSPELYWSGFATGLIGALFLGRGIGEAIVCGPDDQFDPCFDDRPLLITTGAVITGIGVVMMVLGGKRVTSAAAVVPPVSVARPVVTAPASSESEQIARVRTLVDAYTACVFAEADKYTKGPGSASEVADAALSDCRSQYTAMEQASVLFLTPNDQSQAAREAAQATSARTRDDVRRAVISRVLRARQ